MVGKKICPFPAVWHLLFCGREVGGLRALFCVKDNAMKDGNDNL